MSEFVDVFHKLSESAQGAAKSLIVRSALNPMLWLCAIMTPTCFYTAYQFKEKETFCAILIGGGLFPIFCACLYYLILLIKDPSKLQSEEYQIREQALTNINQKVSKPSLNATSIETLARGLENAARFENSTGHQLPAANDGEK
jgi:hypothetical protein